jgi:hypothetical protein
MIEISFWGGGVNVTRNTGWKVWNAQWGRGWPVAGAHAAIANAALERIADVRKKYYDI